MKTEIVCIENLMKVYWKCTERILTTQFIAGSTPDEGERAGGGGEGKEMTTVKFCVLSYQITPPKLHVQCMCK